MLIAERSSRGRCRPARYRAPATPWPRSGAPRPPVPFGCVPGPRHAQMARPRRARDAAGRHDGQARRVAAAPLPRTQCGQRPDRRVRHGRPGGAGSCGAPARHRWPGRAAAPAWTRVRVTGQYDTSREILVRNRTVEGVVGFEVLTPLVLADGSALLVDRGWLRAPPGGATAVPQVPPPPSGQVNVVGPVRLPESRADPAVRRGDHLEVRRIDPARAAPALPYPLYGAYVILDTQEPPGAAGLRSIPPEHQDALQNAGYVVQWWLLAALTLVGFGYLARREAAHREAQRLAEPAAAG